MVDGARPHKKGQFIPMKFILLTLLALLVPSLVPATIVEAVTFEELVKDGQRIFVGEVAAVESFRADLRGNLRIRTRVTFSIDETLRGRGVVAVLEFLGGTVGDLTQEVVGMPRFVVGEPYASNSHQQLSDKPGVVQSWR